MFMVVVGWVAEAVAGRWRVYFVIQAIEGIEQSIRVSNIF
jgi:hypothetical protein